MIVFSKITGAYLFRIFDGFLHIPNTQINYLTGAIIRVHIYSGRGKFMPLSPKSKVLEMNISWITEYFQRLSR
jgi:hypothetical protein